MKMAGVSLIAVASPMPTPAHRLPRGTATSRSPTTSRASTRLIWPNVSVSRIGSSQLTSGSARARAYHRGTRCSATNGDTSQYTVTVSAAAETATNSPAATPNGSTASGRSTSAANGG